LRNGGRDIKGEYGVHEFNYDIVDVRTFTNVTVWRYSKWQLE
jgi:hypothetical protein